MIYTAVCGDTWDSIAFKVYGDEMALSQIMEMNRSFSDTVTFNGGEIIVLPDEIVESSVVVATPWKSGAVTVITAPWG